MNQPTLDQEVTRGLVIGIAECQGLPVEEMMRFGFPNTDSTLRPPKQISNHNLLFGKTPHIPLHSKP
jgi:hypothetical protein